MYVYFDLNIYSANENFIDVFLMQPSKDLYRCVPKIKSDTTH